MKIYKIKAKDITAKYRIDCGLCAHCHIEIHNTQKTAVKFFTDNGWRVINREMACPECVKRFEEMASQKKKKRGPKLTTGRYETRQELIDAIHCIYYSGETVTIEATGRATGVSSCTAAYILSNEKPSTDYRSEFLEQRLGK